ncbi:unnamed protein product [Tuwongella immobilis]|uniref:Uncharacterized protein n=1 Tax=Tuwongella immobilis TaxID=692036 RepID=A0A6C2YUM3_9BACT|nr:unnamed protein product [Tuwongella immobilis]VTS07748.1 unnamed protein product [Tuwongella immobilis]
MPVWELSIGDCLTSMSGEPVSVESVHETNRRQTVYNLRDADFHTDAVGCDEGASPSGRTMQTITHTEDLNNYS